MEYVIKTGLLVFLGAAAEIDYKKRSLNLIFLCVSFTAGFVLQTLWGQLGPFKLLGGAAVGAAFGVISVLSRKAIGAGDSFAIAVCGAWLGIYENILLLLCAFLIMAVVSIVLLAAKKVRARDSLPFLPFLLAGYIAVLAAAL